ncbi:hypothetical protein OIU79_018789 [Salix purpurea]|uniref:Uncharacterized protein n=1 Tax=Salix purpurea TaxID=77065 RepID=A0A9Q0NZQ8_SALPP|nr:hypothetical protein OIU79_018789 [Salix purpurea]
MESRTDPLHRGLLYTYRYVLLERGLGQDVSQWILRIALRGEIIEDGLRDILFVSHSGKETSTPMNCVFPTCKFCGKGRKTAGKIGNAGVIMLSNNHPEYFELKRISSYYKLRETAGLTSGGPRNLIALSEDCSDEE